jgi:hypothetical protein
MTADLSTGVLAFSAVQAGVVIEVTAQGARQAEQLCQPFREALAGLYREFPEGDQRELLRLLEALLDTLRRKGQGGPHG